MADEKEVERIHRLIYRYRMLYKRYYTVIQEYIEKATAEMDTVYEMYISGIINYQDYRNMTSKISEKYNRLIDMKKQEHQRNLDRLGGK